MINHRLEGQKGKEKEKKRLDGEVAKPGNYWIEICVGGWMDGWMDEWVAKPAAATVF